MASIENKSHFISMCPKTNTTKQSLYHNVTSIIEYLCNF